MSGIKCPFCQQELVKDTPFAWNCPNEECVETDMMWGTANMWQELIRTRKALEIAVDKLKGIKAYYDDSYADPHTFVNWHIVAQRLANDADDAIKTITALEQKD